MFKTKQISDIIIKPVIKHNKYNKETVRGYNYFPEPYSNICLMARKKSGKTNVIYRALEQCVKKGTNVFIFSPTVHMDATYEKMIHMLKKKKCNVIAKEHFIDENGVDLIKELLDIMAHDNDEIKEELTEPNQHHPLPLMFFGNDPHYKLEGMLTGGGCRLVERPPPKKEPKKEPKKGAGKLLTPESIIVFDDLSSDLRHKSVSKLLTKNRHYKLKTFFSCHSINNLDPMALSCIDNFLLFPNISNDKIEELKDKINISFKNDNKYENKLQKMYDYATEAPYSFLYIDRNNDCYRKNFNEKLIVDSE